MPTEQDIYDLAKCGYMEARADGVGACFAVMCVVMNRVRSPEFPNTVHDVIYQKNAFSWTRTDDLQYGREPKESEAIWQACKYAAKNVLEGAADATKGALFYANEVNVASSGWYYSNIIKSDKHPITCVLGRHTFRS